MDFLFLCFIIACAIGAIVMMVITLKELMTSCDQNDILWQFEGEEYRYNVEPLVDVVPCWKKLKDMSDNEKAKEINFTDISKEKKLIGVFSSEDEHYCKIYIFEPKQKIEVFYTESKYMNPVSIAYLSCKKDS